MWTVARMQGHHVVMLGANVADAPMSARPPTIKTGDFASVSVRSIALT
jgi:hypothetical protein